MLEAVFRRRLRDFELTFEIGLGPGEILVLTGDNGAGKSTVLNIFAGLMHPDSGLINLGGQILYNSEKGICSPPERRNVGYVFQHYALFPHLSVSKNVAFGLKRRGLPHNEVILRVDEVLSLMGILPLSDLPVTTLSGGQRQRVALARALVLKPDLLLLDEP
ncbi:ATP-binding cassette domain-containing protein, partial [Methanocalculus sp.]|uniref:ATP-binding cassette domain-containing protein n=1 Tax=Methanocalculus sp. TaxID=2004547 RepID=UPI0027201E84